MCCASVTTTLKSRMTLNALCPLSVLSYTESTTIKAGNMTLPCWGSKAQLATVWHSILTRILCACLRWVTSGRRGLLLVSSQAGVLQVNSQFGPWHVSHYSEGRKWQKQEFFNSCFLNPNSFLVVFASGTFLLTVGSYFKLRHQSPWWKFGAQPIWLPHLCPYVDVMTFFCLLRWWSWCNNSSVLKENLNHQICLCHQYYFLCRKQSNLASCVLNLSWSRAGVFTTGRMVESIHNNTILMNITSLKKWHET